MNCFSKGISKDLPLEAKNWNDLSILEQRCKTTTTLSLIALSIIIAAGIAVAIYFCVPTTSTFTNNAGKVVVYSNAGWLSIPIVSGGGGLMVAIAAAIISHFDWGYVEDNKIPDLLLSNITLASDLESAYRQYHRKIRPLVTRQILTVQEAKEFRAILESYHDMQEVKKSYDSLNNTQQTDVNNNPERYPAFRQMKSRLQELRDRWQTLHQTKFRPKPEETS